MNQLVDAMDRYKESGHKVVDSTGPDDALLIGYQLVSSTSPAGKEQALREAARKAAKEGKPLTPGDLLYLSLIQNNGNMRDALLACHAATFPDQTGQHFVEKEGVLAPLRNPAGYNTKADWIYKDGSGIERKADVKEIATDQCGVWYHLFGTAAIEFLDKDERQDFQAAQQAILHAGYLPEERVSKLRKTGYPITGLGRRFADLAIGIEDAYRSMGRRPPDVEKHCINCAGVVAGRELKRRLDLPPRVAPAPEAKPPDLGDPTTFGFDSRLVEPPADGATPKLVVGSHSPLSLAVHGARGEETTFHQTTRQFFTNTPWVVYLPIPEEDGTWAAIIMPMYEVARPEAVATGTGDAGLAIYNSSTRRSAVYTFTVEAGDTITIPDVRKAPLMNGRRLKAVEAPWELRFLDWLVIVGIGLFVIAVIVSAFWLRSRRCRRAKTSGATMGTGVVGPAATLPVPPAATTPAGALPQAQGHPPLCANCGSPLTSGKRFCARCGAPVATGCPACGQEVPPGARFCGICGAVIRTPAEAPPPPPEA